MDKKTTIASRISIWWTNCTTYPLTAHPHNKKTTPIKEVVNCAVKDVGKITYNSNVIHWVRL